MLRIAFRAFQKKRYPAAIVLLEKLLINNPESPYPYFLLCVSYLLSDRFGDAELLMKKIRLIDPEYIPFLQLESFLLVKSSSSINEVLANLVDRIDQYPHDNYFKKAYKLLQKVDDFNNYQRNAKLIDYVFIPKPDKNIINFFRQKQNNIFKKSKNYQSNKNKLSLNYKLFFLCVIFIIGALTYYFFNAPYISVNQPQEEFPIESFNLNVSRFDLIDKIKKNKPPVFYYSNKEVLIDFNKAKFAIKNKKYNNALLLLNKINNSNANFRVKERIDFLKKFITDIDIRNYSDISIIEVIKKPFLYKGVFIKWKGKITNLVYKEDKLFFNLLIDYKKNDIFSGITDVYYDKKQIIINNGDYVLLKGIFINTIGSSNRLYVVANDIEKI